MRWLATTLEHTLDTDPDTGVCNTWPANDELWFRTVMNASTHLNSRTIPDTVKSATKTLFEHALLQNAGSTSAKLSTHW